MGALLLNVKITRPLRKASNMEYTEQKRPPLLPSPNHTMQLGQDKDDLQREENLNIYKFLLMSRS